MNTLTSATISEINGDDLEQPLRKLEFRAMGSQITVLLQQATATGNDPLDEVPGWFEEWEQALSRFRQESELSLLNASAGRATQVSQELWEVLQLALKAAQETGGLVTPTVLGAVESIGYNQTFDALRVAPTTGGHSYLQNRAVPDWRKIELYPGQRTVLLPPGIRLDFGGVAKGWAADQAAARLGQHGPAMVNAGGDIAFSGPLAGNNAWPIGIADPFDAEREIELLRIVSGGVATSGRDYRRWQHNGVEVHHIIDPRSGAPVTTDVLSATVIGPDTAQAEVAAKVALILGSGAGLNWIDSNAALGGLLVLEDDRILRSKNLPQFLWDQD